MHPPSIELEVRHGPCVGIRVIDMSSLVAGPFCGQILSDLGAEVIRVESQGSDILRMVAPMNGELSAYFEQVNRGKKSFEVNVKTAEGLELVRRLADTADVFLQNSRPGVMERLGLGYDDLKQRNNRLIYLSINGFGETGPFAGLPAYDTVIQGLTGFMPIQGGDGLPTAIRSPVADKITAIWAANAAIAALLHRERSGAYGQKVVVDMTTAYSAFMLLEQMGDHTFRSALLPASVTAYSSYTTMNTADGQVIGMILQPNQFKNFCTALGYDHLLKDSRFSDWDKLMKNGELLYSEVSDTVRKITTETFLALMSKNSVPFGRVNTVTDFLESPEAKYAAAYVDCFDPEYGTIRHLNYPAKFERSPADVSRRSPRLGEHNAEIIAELNGGATASG